MDKKPAPLIPKRQPTKKGIKLLKFILNRADSARPSRPAIEGIVKVSVLLADKAAFIPFIVSWFI